MIWSEPISLLHCTFPKAQRMSMIRESRVDESLAWFSSCRCRQSEKWRTIFTRTGMVHADGRSAGLPDSFASLRWINAQPFVDMLRPCTAQASSDIILPESRKDHFD